METATETASTSSESTESAGTTSTATEAPASPQGDTGVQASEANNVVTTSGQATEPAWAPNYKFKVKDKELEFDDFVKPIIKTKEVEAKLKEIYEKAHGIEEVKEGRKVLQTKHQELETKYQAIEGSLQTLGQYVKKKDYRTFFDTLRIPKQDIINYAIEELKYQELPPEQRTAIDQQRQMQTQAMTYEQQNQQLQSQMQELVRQQTAQEMTMEFSNPEVNSAIQAFDARAGQQGAFRAEVIRRGQYYEAVHQISPPASQLVKEVLQFIGGVGSATPATASSQGSPRSNVVVPNQQKPAISTFNAGGSKSPTKKVINSIADLKRAREQLSQQQS